MFRTALRALIFLVPALCGVPLSADELPDEAAIRSAVARSLPLLMAGAEGAAEHKRQCFMCHNQALPVFAITAAATRGFPLDDGFLKRQLTHTHAFLDRNRERYQTGEGQGGQADMAGYALWMLDAGRWPADETTSAVTEYFLKYQANQDHWKSVSDRPPSEKSPFTATYLALRALSRYGASEQQERIDNRREQVREWLVKTPANDTEDLVFRLRALEEARADAAEITQAADNLRSAQREDGGWGQSPDRTSDAYATGSALVALHETAGLATADPAYQRGLAFLLSTQLDDGSWHVVSHSKPFQAYFESGYPHGADQFISIAAAGWATTALALALPLSEPAPTQAAADNPDIP